MMNDADPLVYCEDEQGGTKVRYFPHKVARGENRGKFQLHPRRVPNRHHVRHARFVASIQDVIDLVRTGQWCLRMSPGRGIAASLIEPDRIIIEDAQATIAGPHVDEISDDLVDIDDAYEAEEWRTKLVLHHRHERDRGIIEMKKADVLRRTGELQCEVCDFVFTDLYGEWGAGFIECHHTKPLAAIQKGERTQLGDLAVVCANCHRILHRSTTVLSVAVLRDMVTRRRANNS